MTDSNATIVTLLVSQLERKDLSGADILAITNAIIAIKAATGKEGDYEAVEQRIKELENRISLVESVSNVKRIPASNRRRLM
jgi:hypothetical protein